MRRRFSIYICLLYCVSPLFAQQEPQYTQFMFNKIAYNPAYAGSFVAPALHAIYRHQWIGFEGAPNTQILNFTQKVLTDRFGMGVNLTRNQIGINRTMTAEVSYAYHIDFGYGHHLGVGVQAAARHFWQNWTDERLRTAQPISNDPAVPTDIKSKLVPNFGFGLYYYTSRVYAGLSAPRLLRNNIDFGVDGKVLSKEAFHFNGMFGIDFKFGEEGEEDIKITPQVLLKYTQDAPFDADINVSVLLKNKFYGGLTYRVGGDTNGAGESLAPMIGLQGTDKLFLSLSYDIGLTRLRKYNAGTVEATVRYWLVAPSSLGDVDTPIPK